ncbi:Hsp70 family protein [Kitasatospora sp. NPDC001175]|uniref:Hsp70 family protein n=1 Tax=Kitasatospora sp. NPDC001175 TaxID=3157103 RepID=UPI003D024725
MKKQRVIAAIDFGTHGTGFAWTTINERHENPKRRHISVRTRWKDHPSPYPKNLSALLLNSQGQVVAWGYEARRRWARISARGDEGYQYINGFKMSLASEDNQATEEIPGGKYAPERSRELVTAILSNIYQIAIEEISKSGFVPEEIRWCLTVPAIWNDYQKQLMREAAISAGLPEDTKRLQLVIEPEAAAYDARVSGVRTVHASGRRPSLMSRGSRFLVADCGGGTVDITAYRTDSMNRLEEIGREYGGKYGSEYVNQAFLEKVLSVRFGSYDVIDRILSEAPASLLDLLDSWEKEKVSITDLQDDDIYLPLPAAVYKLLGEEARRSLSECQGGITDFIVVKSSEAKEVFDVVIPGILALVDRQLEEMRRQRRNGSGRELVILVGGFGNSPYLQERLQNHLADRADVLVPPQPEVAVLRGAVHYLYDPQTKSRRTKFTYGCGTSADFVTGVDPEDYKITLPGGREKCRDRFSRFVFSGQSVRVDELVTHQYSPLYADQATVTFKLYTSVAASPRYVTDAGCLKVGEVEVDLSEVMDLPLDRRSIVLAMSFGDVQIEVTATVKETGKMVKSHVDFSPVE